MVIYECSVIKCKCVHYTYRNILLKFTVMLNLTFKFDFVRREKQRLKVKKK